MDSEARPRRARMTSRERVLAAVAHDASATPDRVPVDLGGSAVTGAHACAVTALRRELGLGLGGGGRGVRVTELFQMLGEVEPDLVEAVGADVLPLASPRNFAGFSNSGWKPWNFHDGTPLLVPELFNITPEPDGTLFQYPEGDRTVPPSLRLAPKGYFFDALDRQQYPIDDATLRVEDNTEEFKQISQEDLNFYSEQARYLYNSTDKAILFNPGGLAFGDIALVPAPWLKNPRGIRGISEWYMSTATRKEFVYKVFESQLSVGLDNLRRLHDAVGEQIQIIFTSGTDFGMQTGTLISPRSYRELYKPFHTKINEWIHNHTTWKTFIHCCGSCVTLIEDFIQAGFDILNPVQCSAAGMDPVTLKTKFGRRIAFWGGGVDTQKTLPFGTPEEVTAQVQDRLRIFGEGGGYVWNTTHNIQGNVPSQNIVAMYRAIHQYNNQHS
ncbi:methyltransferase CmuC [Pelomyxa schiedti]|nr:methyltransferase CmuC [Pelomyxa schiedti]